MRFTGWLILVLIVGGPAAGEVTAQSCPADQEWPRQIVVNFLTKTALADERDATGTAGLSPGDIRVLHRGRDRAICTELDSIVEGGEYVQEPWIRVYYEVGGFYFVAFWKDLEPGQIRLGFSPLIVLDGSLNPLGAFAM